MDSDITVKIINCVTNNTSELFSNYLSSGSIKKGNQASFNLFNYKQNYFVDSYNINPNLYNLDKESLTHVWSAGKQVDIT
jgi:cytosine/adenosine deaminase-related metal-dependent hydrolase